MRDVLLGNTPVFWMHETEYLWMCLATTVGVFFLWSYLAERGEGIKKRRGRIPCLPLLVYMRLLLLPATGEFVFLLFRHGNAES